MNLVDALANAKNLLASGDDITYPSRVSANHVRGIVRDLVEALEKVHSTLAWIEKKTADKRNPAVAFVCRQILDGKEFSPLRDDDQQI